MGGRTVCFCSATLNTGGGMMFVDAEAYIINACSRYDTTNGNIKFKVAAGWDRSHIKGNI